MAKNQDHIEMRDGKASLAYVDDAKRGWQRHPWGIRPPVSTEIPAGTVMTAAEMFRAARANFDVEMRDVFTLRAEPTANGKMARPVDGYRAVIRTDTDEPLAIVGGRYETVGNRAIAEMLDASGFRADSVAVLGRGEKGYAQMWAGEDSIRGDDTGRIASYLSVFWSHDGSSTVLVGRSRVGIVCANTYGHAKHEVKQKATEGSDSARNIRHVSGAEARLFDLADEMRAEAEARSAFLDSARRMASVQVPAGVATEMLDKAYGASRQAANVKAEILAILRGEDPTTGAIGDGSAWDVFQAATFLDSHNRTVKGLTGDQASADAVRRLRGPSDRTLSLFGALDAYAVDAAPVVVRVGR